MVEVVVVVVVGGVGMHASRINGREAAVASWAANGNSTSATAA